MNCLLKYANRMFLKRTLLIGSLLVSSLPGVAMARGQSEKVPAKPAKKAAAKSAPASSPRLYSAERSLTRQAKLARARAAAMARETAAAQPRYKTDDAGDIVPD